MPPKRKMAKESQEEECSNKKVKATQTGVKRKVSEMSLEEKSELKRRQPSQFCCEEECFKKASFGEINQCKTHCGQHKTGTMEGKKNKKQKRPKISSMNVTEKIAYKKNNPSRFCIEQDCFSTPQHGYVNKSKTHCYLHKTLDMTSRPRITYNLRLLSLEEKLALKQQRPYLFCIHENCITKAGYGKPRKYCGKHLPESISKPKKSKKKLTLEEKVVLKKKTPSQYCKVFGCFTKPSYGFINGPKIYCTLHKMKGTLAKSQKISLLTLQQKKQHKLRAPSKYCCTQNCFNSPTYGKNGNLNVCWKHKQDDDFPGNRMTCKYTSCMRAPTCGTEKERPVYCKKHKSAEMFSCRNLCENELCRKKRLYGFLTGKPKFCKVHKEKNMERLKIKKCQHSGCEKEASFGTKTQKRVYCAYHAVGKNLNDFHNSLCDFTNCTTSASFGFQGDKRRRCYTHQLIGMIQIGRSFCNFKGCQSTSRSFGNHISGRAFCAKHRDKKVHWKLTTCKHAKCKDIATHSESGLFPFSLCHEHAPVHYNSVHETKCVGCNLTLLCDEDGKCLLTCTKKHAERQKRTENALNAFLEKNNMDFLRDVSPSTDCTMQRPDFIFKTPFGVVVIENDENQHRHLTEETETRRMICLHQAFGEPVHFLRFNPDSYLTSDGVKQYMDLSDRHKVLFSVLRQILETPQEFFSTHPFLSAQKLYFNGFTDIESVVVQDVVY